MSADRKGWVLAVGGLAVLFIVLAQPRQLLWAAIAVTAAVLLLLFGPAVGEAIGEAGGLPLWRRRERSYGENGRLMKQRLSQTAAAFELLAGQLEKSVPHKQALDEQDMSHIFEELSEHLCQNCIECPNCWDGRFAESYADTCTVLENGCAMGRLTESEVPDTFRERCICTDSFVEEINRGIAKANTMLSWENKLAESREAVAGQLREAAGMLRGFSHEAQQGEEQLARQKRLILTKMRTRGVRVRDICVLSRQAGREVFIEARGIRGGCMPAKEAAALLGGVLNCRLVQGENRRNIIGREFETFAFYEDTKFSVLTGVARAAKEDSEVSGDSFSFLNPAHGSMVMLLSDGMGSGTEANQESTLVVELIERFLEAGFSEDAAIRFINSLLVLRSEQVMFSTIDMSILNLFTGTCELIKAGASTTFIKRRDWVEAVSSSAMPAGVVNRLDYEVKQVKLNHGDYLIMLSDGILDCLSVPDKELYLQQKLSGLKERNPQDIANRILELVLCSEGYRPIDDMTVLVTGLWEKR